MPNCRIVSARSCSNSSYRDDATGGGDSGAAYAYDLVPTFGPVYQYMPSTSLSLVGHATSDSNVTFTSASSLPAGISIDGTTLIGNITTTPVATETTRTSGTKSRGHNLLTVGIG